MKFTIIAIAMREDPDSMRMFALPGHVDKDAAEAAVVAEVTGDADEADAWDAGEFEDVYAISVTYFPALRSTSQLATGKR